MTRFLKISIYSSLFFIISLTNTYGQATPNEITDKFFEIYSTDPTKALDYLFSTNKWTGKIEDAILDQKNKIKNLINLCGECYGHEILSEKTAGQNIKMMTFILRYDREPIRFTFLFYKPKDKWQLNNFTYDDDIEADLKEATKLYRLKENMLW